MSFFSFKKDIRGKCLTRHRSSQNDITCTMLLPFVNPVTACQSNSPYKAHGWISTVNNSPKTNPFSWLINLLSGPFTCQKMSKATCSNVSFCPQLKRYSVNGHIWEAEVRDIWTFSQNDPDRQVWFLIRHPLPLIELGFHRREKNEAGIQNCKLAFESVYM